MKTILLLIKQHIVLALFFFCLPVATSQAQTSELSASAKSMASQGLVNIHDVDPTIQVSLMYSRSDNFCGEVLYQDLREAYLHPEAAKALKEAQRYLKKLYPNLSLKIYDAARPMSIQEYMWERVKDTPQNIYVSNPNIGGGMHNYGMAVDITLCDERGDTLDMGTKVDHFGPEAHIDKEKKLVKQNIMSVQALKNRKILRKVMCHAGFMTMREEWWHFNLCSRETAKKYYPVVK